ncbi:MAG: hypothetical protein FWC43_02065 [Planctomycetaceae bacterium]|nr:hypothetical protein [Planctomycetaceae bacterium]
MRLLDWISPTSNKELRQRIQSADEQTAWNYWSDLLERRAKTLELGNLTAQFTEEPVFNSLRTACSLLIDVRKTKPNLWCRQLESLIHELESPVETKSEPLRSQLLGELGLLLSLAFPDLKPMKSLGERARKKLAEGFDQLLDGAGLPKSENLSLLRPLLACWTRCLELGKNAQSYPWKLKSQQQYEWAVLQSLRLTRSDGSAVFSPPQLQDASTKSTQPCKKRDSFCKTIEVALSHDSDPLDKNVAQVVFSGQKTRTNKEGKMEADLPLPRASFFSNWSRFAMLRPHWDHVHPSVAITYGKALPNGESNAATPFGGWSDSRIGLELNFQSQTIFSGSENVSVVRGGKKLTTDGDWTSLCEIHEPTHDYLELECFLGEGFRIQRHFLLAHDEEILILADSVLPRKEFYTQAGKKKSDNALDESARLEYELRIPLSPWMRVQPGEPQGTERVLFSTSVSKERPLLRVLPLALPEWQSNISTGELVVEENSLVLRQFGTGVALFAPLFFDLSPSRIRYPYTWRQLSVGEKRERTTDDQAVGFRIQLHKNQYLFYRSLTEQRNRTVLGHNLVSDLFFGHFNKEHGVETILEVEEE